MQPLNSWSKITKSFASAGKVVAGLVFFLEWNRVIPRKFLDQLDEKLSGTRPELHKKKKHFSFGQCIGPQRCYGNEKINRFELRIDSDFLQFPNLKTNLSGKRFGSNDKLMAAVDGYFEIFYNVTSEMEYIKGNVGQITSN